MKHFKEFFRSKAFYIAFGTGILAFSGLLLAYNYSDNREGLKQEQTALLNEPIEQATEEFAPVESNGVLTGEELDRINAEVLADEEDDVDVEESSTEADSLDAKSEDDNQVETSASTETDAQVASMGDDAAIASQDSSEYSYNGEQSLAWPLNGDVILPYSMDTTVYYATLKAYKCNPGMLIAGSEGTDIVSAYDGVVESVVDDQEHGTIVTVDMGNGYKCSYGQLMNVTVAEGDEVVLGQNLGEVAPVTSYYTEEGTHLYFAMTKDGEPVNPMLYIQ
ncbi:MAG: M23 family metallopeptidase [Lachnospiraceae bacterium]|nr:M23 family metallopeptidase [Lachnospiraceae bacterium]MBQ8318349.1 M23 family metallopeptidase [Lachnospiraceae bacterium]